MNEHEENQISLIPTPEDGMRGVYEETQEREDLSKFQHIVDGFFAQTKEPALTISGKTVTVNVAAV